MKKTRPHRSYCFLSMLKLCCKRHYRNLATYIAAVQHDVNTSRKRRRCDADIRSAAAAAAASRSATIGGSGVRKMSAAAARRRRRTVLDSGQIASLTRKSFFIFSLLHHVHRSHFWTHPQTQYVIVRRFRQGSAFGG